MMNFFKNLLGFGSEQNDQNQNDNQQESSWSLSSLIERYGPVVQQFLETLATELAEQNRRAQEEYQAQQQRRAQQFYALSGLPIITGNPMLDQMIILSNADHFQSNVAMGGNGVQFSFNLAPNSNGRVPTMEEILTATFNQAQNTGTAAATDHDAISRLPTVRLTKERIEFKNKLQENMDTDACAICVEDYKVDEKLIQLPCGHVFHNDCIMPWIKEHNTCPTCRFELPLEDENQERERLKRMRERFTDAGLKIMQIGIEDETIFDKLYDIRSEMEKVNHQFDDQMKKKLMSNLTSCGSFLDTRLSKLDQLNTSENDRAKHLRRNEILKIQFLQDRIENMERQLE